MDLFAGHSWLYASHRVIQLSDSSFIFSVVVLVSNICDRCQQQSIFIVSFRSSLFLPTICSSSSRLQLTKNFHLDSAASSIDANQSKTDEPFQMVQNFSVSLSCQRSSPAILSLTYQPVSYLLNIYYAKIMEQKNYEELEYL
ncbi:hypothetical protein T01_7541 [Trichinella spiralis]|uniref:Uncharacterized protein n=1 Tax=Trichinella spiralis TaxID=6334 RepID=A0A0V1AZE0_TRISP|nr:hypothetical protein T01_7541 [Trichinella spiralis]